MTLHFVREMDQLHRDILSMCSMVEEIITEAVEGLRAGRADLAKAIEQRDDEVNAWDIRIEEECLKILALYHPMANDLRRVAVVMKITSELERVGDLAVGISQRSAGITSGPMVAMPERLGEMAEQALTMLHSSIDAFVEMDAEKAYRVCRMDDAVDQLNVELLEEVRIVMAENPSVIPSAMHLFSAIRQIERVADHAQNIAEDVVYLVTGEIIRHPRVNRES